MPLRYALIDGEVYFHVSIKGGHKTERFVPGAKASFTVVESQDGIKARSAIIFGAMEILPEMRLAVLEKFVEKFVPPFAWEQAKAGAHYAQNGIIAYKLKAEHTTAKFLVNKNELVL